MFINFWFFFPGPTALIKALRLLNFRIFPRVYRYFQDWWGFCLFKALCLFFLANFSGQEVIPCPTTILDSRVFFLIDLIWKCLLWKQESGVVGDWFRSGRGVIQEWLGKCFGNDFADSSSLKWTLVTTHAIFLIQS